MEPTVFRDLLEKCEVPQTVSLPDPIVERLGLHDVMEEDDEALQEGEHAEWHHQTPHVEDLGANSIG